MIICKKIHQLLQADDLAPFEMIGERYPTSPVLIVCDHASNYVPLALNQLETDAPYFEQHIAYDIGAAAVTRQLVDRLQATGVLSGFSRLVIDANRFLTSHDSIPSISDGVAIKGNEALSLTDQFVRVEELFIPYHDAINRAIAGIRQHFSFPLVLSVHSYTPVFQGFERPWEIGVVWEGDDGVASMLMDYLEANTDFHIGDNEPYHACNPVGYTMKTHAESKGYPHVMIEIRQDLVADARGQAYFAKLLFGAMKAIHESLEGVIVRR